MPVYYVYFIYIDQKALSQVRDLEFYCRSLAYIGIHAFFSATLLLIVNCNPRSSFFYLNYGLGNFFNGGLEQSIFYQLFCRLVLLYLLFVGRFSLKATQLIKESNSFLQKYFITKLRENHLILISILDIIWATIFSLFSSNAI